MSDLNVILLDDSLTFLQGTTDLLTRAGVNAVPVTSWIDLGSAMLRHSADLVVLDLNMPGFEGDQVGRMIRRFSSCPILFLSSEPTERLTEICREIPGTAWLEKRLARERLVEVVLALAAREGTRAK